MNRTIRITALLFAAGTWTFGQEYRGTITGIVTDASSAAVPGVKMQLTNVETAAVYNTESSL